MRYQADQKCLIYEELASIFRKTTGLADVLRELLAPLREEITLALIFGSIVQGKARASSDVDLLVVGAVSFAEVVEACHAGTARLNREVNPVVMTKTAFQAKQQAKDRFVSRIAHEEKIFLLGDMDEFRKLSENRAA